MRTILIVIVVATGCLWAIQAKRLVGVRSSYGAAITENERVAREIGRVHELRRLEPQVAQAEHPTEDVIQQINTVLRRSGLDESVLVSLTPIEDSRASHRTGGTAGTRGDVSRQSIRLELRELLPEELGRFLVRWRAEHPIWIVAAAELMLEGGRAAQAGGRYHVTLTFTAEYLNL